MVAITDAILVLQPAAVFGRGGTCRVADLGDGSGPSITFWSPSLGTQPTAQQLAAVTAGQVAAYYAAQAVASAQGQLADTTSAQGRALQAVMGAANLAPARVQARAAGAVPRPMMTLATAILGLTTAQWNNVVANLFAGNPAPWQQDTGPNITALSAVYVAVVNASGAPVFANKFQQIVVAALYVQDNPAYLVNPAFDPSINIPGT